MNTQDSSPILCHGTFESVVFLVCTLLPEVYFVVFPLWVVLELTSVVLWLAAVLIQSGRWHPNTSPLNRLSSNCSALISVDSLIPNTSASFKLFIWRTASLLNFCRCPYQASPMVYSLCRSGILMSSLSLLGTDFWGSLVAPSVSVPLSVLSSVWVGSVCDCGHASGPSDLLLAVLLPHWELPRFLFGVGTMLLGA